MVVLTFAPLFESRNDAVSVCVKKNSKILHAHGDGVAYAIRTTVQTSVQKLYGRDTPLTIFSFLFGDGEKKGLVDLRRPFCSTDSQI